jgi:hypothetical protein
MCGRLLINAIQFQYSYPFVNPSRAPPSIVRLEHGRFVLRNPGYMGQNAVFLMSGLMMECSLISGTSSYGSLIPNVKRIRIMPFTTEYECAVAYFGHHIDMSASDSFVSPIYRNGVVFASKKEGYGAFCKYYFIYCT